MSTERSPQGIRGFPARNHCENGVLSSRRRACGNRRSHHHRHLVLLHEGNNVSYRIFNRLKVWHKKHELVINAVAGGLLAGLAAYLFGEATQ